MKKTIIIIAIALLSIGAAVFMVGLAFSGFDIAKLDNAKYENNAYDLSEEVGKIEISTQEAEITFKKSENGEIRVECYEREKVKHEVLIENGTLKITAVDKRKWYDYITFFSFGTTHVTVYLDSDYYDSLFIDNIVGKVSVPSAFSFGSSDIKTTTGDVNFGATVRENLKIKTTTGDVNIESVSAENIDVSVTTGRIECKKINCSDKLSLKVSTGRTTLTDVNCKEFVSEGSTGRLTLKNVVATDSFDIERSTGDVSFDNCDAEKITVKTSTGDVWGTLRSEKVFNAKTTTGKVSVPNSVSGGKCEIITTTGDIEISIVK